ncbi:ATP-binding protein [Pedosphaera parvula]|uniref:histidine kinase n=1 Tax=Pedosphaera parvula (strain Ellin514) TaxID=320771 RepID=B9XCZ0_PEDPL|nr:ATP-binding protein [Pedosphaera parvula]EEF62336.1 integral membrane sensor signal transduction histidine kinase [Pedosphaera parvula Ellin514]
MWRNPKNCVPAGKGFGFLTGAMCGVLLLGILRAGGQTPVPNDTQYSVINSIPAPLHSVLDATNAVGSWIWDKETQDKQTCRFWRVFEVPRDNPVVRAEMRITADNGYDVFLDGRKVGHGIDWKWLSTYDLSYVLPPGKHVLAIEAFNEGQKAGLILGLRMQLTDGRVLEVASDRSWYVVPDEGEGWRSKEHPLSRWYPAIVVGVVGDPPWWKTPVSTVIVPPIQPLTLHFWGSTWFQVVILSLCGMAMVICLRLMAKVALQSKEQKLLQLERNRIARDIHDDLGARLTELVLLGEVAQSERRTEPETLAQIDQICERARGVLGAIDEIVWVVNSRRDTLKDFVTYVCKYAQLFLRSSNIRCRLDIEPDLPSITFDLPVRRNLLLAVKEALNNAAKHSQATELFLRVHRDGMMLRVIVEDNGVGFEPAEANLERNGLTNMGQRMKELGGEYRVVSRPGNGSRIEFLMPLENQRLRSNWFGWLWRIFTAKVAPVQEKEKITPAEASQPTQ